MFQRRAWATWGMHMNPAIPKLSLDLYKLLHSCKHCIGLNLFHNSNIGHSSNSTLHEELNSCRSTLPQMQFLVCWTQHRWSAEGHWPIGDLWLAPQQLQNPNLHDGVESPSCSGTSWTGRQRCRSLLGAQSQVLQKLGFHPCQTNLHRLHLPASLWNIVTNR